MEDFRNEQTFGELIASLESLLSDIEANVKTLRFLNSEDEKSVQVIDKALLPNIQKTRKMLKDNKPGKDEED